jgi:hypothetical protein
VLEVLAVTRVVAAPDSLDRATFSLASIVLRTAPDDVMVIGGGLFVVDDQNAIVREDAGWSGVWVNRAPADAYLKASCSWPRPTARPAFAQGAIAHLAVKLWLTEERTLFVLPTALTADFVERTPPEWSV